MQTFTYCTMLNGYSDVCSVFNSTSQAQIEDDIGTAMANAPDLSTYCVPDLKAILCFGSLGSFIKTTPIINFVQTSALTLKPIRTMWARVQPDAECHSLQNLSMIAPSNENCVAAYPSSASILATNLVTFVMLFSVLFFIL